MAKPKIYSLEERLRADRAMTRVVWVCFAIAALAGLASNSVVIGIATLVALALFTHVMVRMFFPRLYRRLETGVTTAEKADHNRASVAETDRYGERHHEVRAHWARIIREQGGTCSEEVCVMPTRRIEPGAYFHLAHDHKAGGARDYLGPAHPECNEYEAQQRGVTWPGMVRRGHENTPSERDIGSDDDLDWPGPVDYERPPF